MSSTTLSDDDREALRQSVNDLSDICPCRLAEYERGMAEAYKRAKEIQLGQRNPLWDFE